MLFVKVINLKINLWLVPVFLLRGKEGDDYEVVL